MKPLVKLIKIPVFTMVFDFVGWDFDSANPFWRRYFREQALGVVRENVSVCVDWAGWRWTEFPNLKFVFHFFKAVFATSFRPLRPFSG